MNAIPLSGNNRHPVDELADVREAMKSLKAREDELKAIISNAMGSADHLGGDEFIATQTLSERKGGLDEKAMKAAGIDTDRYRKASTVVTTIRVERREREVA